MQANALIHKHAAKSMRILTLAALYFAIVFGVGFVLGPIRITWLEPWLGKTIATLCETPLLLAVMVASARWVPKKVGLSRDVSSLAAMGIGALIFQQIADFAVGIGLRGMMPVEQLAYLVTPAGLIYVALLVAFAFMPVLVNNRS
jgi:hypothetical protein